jgi:hypothetical protein
MQSCMRAVELHAVPPTCDEAAAARAHNGVGHFGHREGQLQRDRVCDV